jgi:hypothetical protein
VYGRTGALWALPGTSGQVREEEAARVYGYIGTPRANSAGASGRAPALPYISSQASVFLQVPALSSARDAPAPESSSEEDAE